MIFSVSEMGQLCKTAPPAGYSRGWLWASSLSLLLSPVKPQPRSSTYLPHVSSLPNSIPDDFLFLSILTESGDLTTLLTWLQLGEGPESPGYLFPAWVRSSGFSTSFSLTGCGGPASLSPPCLWHGEPLCAVYLVPPSICGISCKRSKQSECVISQF